MSSRELQNITQAVKSGWISSLGEFIQQFESQFAAYHDVNHAVALSNGTAALEVALHAIDIRPGDEVIVPSFTIISVAVAVVRMGAIPRFADSEARSWNINPTCIEKLISPKTKAIIVVHGFGHPADMDSILQIAKSHNLKIIEDAAEAIASKHEGTLCGTMGDIAAFSLYANKLVTTGEGGMVITNNDEYAERARRYINLYFGKTDRFTHDDLGYNFRMTNMQAAIGCGQMDQIDEFTARKLEIGEWYREALLSSNVATFQPTHGDVRHVYWMYCVTLDDRIERNAEEALAHLHSNGIGGRRLFKGLHLQPPLRQFLTSESQGYPVTEKLYERGFYIPSGLNLTQSQVYQIVETIDELR